MIWSFPPGYGLVPPEVIASRLEGAAQALAQAGLTALLATQAPDVYYYSGSCQQGVVLVTAEGQGYSLGRYFVRRHVGRAMAESPLAVTAVAGLSEVAGALGLAWTSCPPAPTWIGNGVCPGWRWPTPRPSCRPSEPSRTTTRSGS